MSEITHPWRPVGRLPAAVWSLLTARPWIGLVLGAVLTLGLRLPFVGRPLTDDEGGFLYVAQHWFDPGHWLYGPQWVDRPPVLILVFRLGALLGGTPTALRLLAIGFALLLVASAWWAGRTLGGDDGALAAALVAAGLASNPLILGYALVGDGIAAAFVMLSCALLLAALREDRLRSLPLAALAGAVAVLAFLTKQDALLGGVFAFALLVFNLRRKWALLLAYAGGALVPLAATVVWAVTGPGLAMVVNALYTFRMKAAHLLWSDVPHPPVLREEYMAHLLLRTGLGLVLLLVLVDVTLRRTQWALRAGIILGAAYVTWSIVLSLNYFPYYLLGMIPVAALGIALAMGGRRPGWQGSLVRPVAGVLVVAVVALAVADAFVPVPKRLDELAVEHYLRHVAHPGDSALVTYGQPNVLEGSGLSTPYPYAWSLPLRVEDPHTDLMAATLAGPRAPTWLVEIGHLDMWGIAGPRLHRAVHDDYHLATIVCGHDIYLRDGVHRHVHSHVDRADGLLVDTTREARGC